LRTPFEPEGGGLWGGKAWGHPVFLLDYGGLDLRQEDALPLAMLRRDLGAPAAIRDVLLARRDRLHRFGPFIPRYQPQPWDALKAMSAENDIIDWAEVARVTTPDIDKFVPHLPTDQVIHAIGERKAIETIGKEKALDIIGKEEALRMICPDLTPEQIAALLKKSAGG
jgi:hypothetical protein